MVGRAQEQQFISDAIADPDRAGVLVAGQAGVGKTRLIHEVLSWTSDHHIEWITASESLRPLPFGALAQLLPSNLHEVDQVDLLAVLGQDLQHRAEGRAIILAVDDVHLLDGLSAGFIDYVAIRGLATVLLTLAQWIARPRCAGQTHSTRRLFRGLSSRRCRDPSSTRCSSGLSTALSRASPAERMWEATRGNVLFARELIADLLEAGELRLDPWRMEMARRSRAGAADPRGNRGPPRRAHRTRTTLFGVALRW